MRIALACLAILLLADQASARGWLTMADVNWAMRQSSLRQQIREARRPARIYVVRRGRCQ